MFRKSPRTADSGGACHAPLSAAVTTSSLGGLLAAATIDNETWMPSTGPDPVTAQAPGAVTDDGPAGVVAAPAQQRVHHRRVHLCGRRDHRQRVPGRDRRGRDCVVRVAGESPAYRCCVVAGLSRGRYGGDTAPLARARLAVASADARHRPDGGIGPDRSYRPLTAGRGTPRTTGPRRRPVRHDPCDADHPGPGVGED